MPSVIFSYTQLLQRLNVGGLDPFMFNGFYCSSDILEANGSKNRS